MRGRGKQFKTRRYQQALQAIGETTTKVKVLNVSLCYMNVQCSVD